jgi:hypothetical protein
MKAPFMRFNWYKNELSVLIKARVTSPSLNQSARNIMKNLKHQKCRTVK